MYDETITLVSIERETDDYGDKKEKKTERIVFAELKSISQSEFYQAQAVGMKPEIKFVIADYYDYDGEKVLKYTNHRGKTEEYKILRTFRKGTELEIICKRGID